MLSTQQNSALKLPSDYRYSFQGQESDDEIKGEGNSINYTYRMHDPRVGRFFAVDPLAVNHPGESPFVFCSDNSIFFVDPDGRENIPALMWALNHMVNQDIESTYLDPWYGSSDGGWVYEPGVIPTRIVCYESCWISYMNAADDRTLKILKTGFATSSGGFRGRSSKNGGINWFKEGDGTDRKFETDIKEGELGDIVFMGESKDMEGHSVLLASEIKTEMVEINGVMVEQVYFTTLSTSSTTDPGCYGIKEYRFQKNEDGSYTQVGGSGYEFRGYGQMTNIDSTQEDIDKAKSLILEKSTKTE